MSTALSWCVQTGKHTLFPLWLTLFWCNGLLGSGEEDIERYKGLVKGGEIRVLLVGAEEVEPKGSKNYQDEEQDG